MSESFSRHKRNNGRSVRNLFILSLSLCYLFLLLSSVCYDPLHVRFFTETMNGTVHQVDK